MTPRKLTNRLSKETASKKIAPKKKKVVKKEKFIEEHEDEYGEENSLTWAEEENFSSEEDEYGEEEENFSSDDSIEKKSRRNSKINDDYNKAYKIIISGFEEELSKDEILANLYESGIRFSDVMKFYKKITRENKLVRDTKTIKENIIEFLDTNKNMASIIENLAENEYITSISYNEVLPIITEVLKNIKDSTERLIISVLKKELDVNIGRKPKGTSFLKRNINKVVVEFFVNAIQEKDTYSNEDIKRYVSEFEKTLSQYTSSTAVKRWTTMFPLLFAIKAHLTPEETESLSLN